MQAEWLSIIYIAYILHSSFNHMYTKKDMIAHITHETNIIKHLHEKIQKEDLSYKPNDHQWSMEWLLQHLSRMTTLLINFLQNKAYDPVIAKELRITSESQDMIKDFPWLMDKQLNAFSSYIESLSDEELDEEIDLFGMNQPQSIKSYLLHIGIKNYASYGMQLFQYMKQGREMYHLNTSNLWRGKDAEK